MVMGAGLLGHAVGWRCGPSPGLAAPRGGPRSWVSGEPVGGEDCPARWVEHRAAREPAAWSSLLSYLLLLLLLFHPPSLPSPALAF